ncbi:MAG: GTP cyclohydrolase I, partial [Acidobacteriota bacterium]|nr:GTP cyclohydrolase I [Acidobacteriota bacterium]
MNKKRAVVKVLSPKTPEKPIAPLVSGILDALGEDRARDGLLRTPERVEKALRYLTSGYHADLAKIVNNAIFEVKYDEMVIVKDIE